MPPKVLASIPRRPLVWYANRAPGRAWALRRDLTDYVCTDTHDEIRIFVNNRALWMTRPTARLLAKRINQCLDATVKR